MDKLLDFFMRNRDLDKLMSGIIEIIGTRKSPFVQIWDIDYGVYCEHRGDSTVYSYEPTIIETLLKSCQVTVDMFYIKSMNILVYINNNDPLLHIDLLLNQMGYFFLKPTGETDNIDCQTNIAGGTISVSKYGIIKSFNAGLEHLFGYQSYEIIGHNISILIPESYNDHIGTYLEKHTIDPFQRLTACKKDGTIFPIQLYVSKLDMESYIGIICDVVVPKDIINANSSDKELFIINMSHEIRTPLNGIIGITQILNESRDLPQKFHELINIIDTCSKHLLTIINDILDYSKISAGCMDLRPCSFNLIDCIEKCHDTVASVANRKKIEINHIFSHSFPRMVYADEQRISQIIINLLSNAVKFTNSGSVTTECSVVVSSRSDNISHIVIRVIDTGIGISEDKIPLIFTTYGQVVDNYTKVTEGTGLGLTIAINLAKKMGGDITVQSTLGKGSIFTFTCDVKTFDNVDDDVSDQMIDSLCGIKVLIVDDNASNRVSLYHILTRYEMIVTLCSSPDEVILLFNHNAAYDIILMDICMPKINGVELSHRIRKIRPDIPIIALSSIDDVSLYDRDLFNDAMIKPVKRYCLLNSILSVLKNTRVPVLEPAKNIYFTSKLQAVVNKSFNKERILVVEDNESNIYIIVMFLKSYGYIDIGVARNGLDAVNILMDNVDNQYYIILMDLKMPIVNGQMAIQKIRELYQCASEPPYIIAVSASNDRCTDNDVYDFITKPVEKKILFDALNKYNPSLDLIASE